MEISVSRFHFIVYILTIRKKAGDPLPTTDAELLAMQETDPRVKVIAGKM